MDMSIDEIDRRINGHTQLEAVKVQNYKLKVYRNKKKKRQVNSNE